MNMVRILNQAAEKAEWSVLAAAQRYKKREDYRPLEELARRIRAAVLQAGADFINEQET